MKSRTLICIAATTLFAALAISVRLRLAAQEEGKEHTRYKLIDIGTFGGPMSTVNVAVNGRDINSQGATVGDSATSIPAPPSTNGFGCLGPDGTVPFIFHAFESSNGLVTDLGSLGEASNCSAAQWINDRGEIAGVSQNGVIDPATGLTEIRAVLWKDGKIKDLGTFGGNHSYAAAINNRGQVTGFALNAIPDPFSILDVLAFGSSNGTQTRAFLYERGVMQDLGTLGGPDAIVGYLNDRGQVTGASYTNSTPNPATGIPTLDPFLWENGKMHDLGTLGGTLGSPNGLNNRGQVIGQSNLAGDKASDQFLWEKGKLTDLTTQSIGGTLLAAAAINDAGEIVGGGAFPGRVFDAALWRNGVLTDLGTLDGDCFSFAENIDSSGRVVGESFSCDFSNQRAFLWKSGVLIDLNTLIPSDSPLQLVAGLAINDRAVIARVGVPPGVPPGDVNTRGHAFVLLPCGQGDEDGCQGENPAGATQTNPATTTPEHTAGAPAPPALGGRGMLDRLRGRRFPWRRPLGPATGPAN